MDAPSHLCRSRLQYFPFTKNKKFQTPVGSAFQDGDAKTNAAGTWQYFPPATRRLEDFQLSTRACCCPKTLLNKPVLFSSCVSQARKYAVVMTAVPGHSLRLWLIQATRQTQTSHLLSTVSNSQTAEDGRVASLTSWKQKGRVELRQAAGRDRRLCGGETRKEPWVSSGAARFPAFKPISQGACSRDYCPVVSVSLAVPLRTTFEYPKEPVTETTVRGVLAQGACSRDYCPVVSVSLAVPLRTTFEYPKEPVIETTVRWCLSVSPPYHLSKARHPTPPCAGYMSGYHETHVPPAAGYPRPARQYVLSILAVESVWVGGAFCTVSGERACVPPICPQWTRANRGLFSPSQYADGYMLTVLFCRSGATELTETFNYNRRP
ncbi:hypothetical protein Bbelb_266320 [Branchiostoma belcheri]|nr:hypothetical protein Bbelb_266320 [Branchiostoma belcheri]